MENKKELICFLGLMSKARNTINGERLIDSIRAKKVYFVIIGEDIGKSSFKKITDKCKSFDVPFVICLTKEELSQAVGKNNCSSVGITDVNGALKIKKIMKVGE